MVAILSNRVSCLIFQTITSLFFFFFLKYQPDYRILQTLNRSKNLKFLLGKLTWKILVCWTREKPFIWKQFDNTLWPNSVAFRKLCFSYICFSYMTHLLPHSNCMAVLHYLSHTLIWLVPHGISHGIVSIMHPTKRSWQMGEDMWQLNHSFHEASQQCRKFLMLDGEIRLCFP